MTEYSESQMNRSMNSIHSAEICQGKYIRHKNYKIKRIPFEETNQ